MTEIDVDEVALAEAMLFIGTDSIDDAVNASLRWIVEHGRLRANPPASVTSLD